MQEPKDDKDEEFCKKVNEYLNNPPAPNSSGSRGSGGGSGSIPGLDLSSLGDTELQSLLQNMSQSQLMQLFGGKSFLNKIKIHVMYKNSFTIIFNRRRWRSTFH